MLITKPTNEPSEEDADDPTGTPSFNAEATEFLDVTEPGNPKLREKD